MNTITLDGNTFHVGDGIEVYCTIQGMSTPDWQPGTVKCIHDRVEFGMQACIIFDNKNGLRGVGCSGSWRIGNTDYHYQTRPCSKSPLLSMLRKQTSVNA